MRAIVVQAIGDEWAQTFTQVVVAEFYGPPLIELVVQEMSYEMDAATNVPRSRWIWETRDVGG